LEAWEFFLVDRGYGGPWAVTPSNTPADAKDPFEIMMGKARARHETINRRFKEFGALHQEWRHDLTLHNRCFWVIAHLVQLKIDNEGLAYKVNYDDREYLRAC
jgi:hypothetical protein